MAYCEIPHKEEWTKGTTAIHRPLGPVFYPNEKANVIADYLEPVHAAQSV
jgi:hypothetical protein